MTETDDTSTQFIYEDDMLEAEAPAHLCPFCGGTGSRCSECEDGLLLSPAERRIVEDQLAAQDRAVEMLQAAEDYAAAVAPSVFDYYPYN